MAEAAKGYLIQRRKEEAYNYSEFSSIVVYLFVSGDLGYITVAGGLSRLMFLEGYE